MFVVAIDQATVTMLPFSFVYMLAFFLFVLPIELAEEAAVPENNRSSFHIVRFLRKTANEAIFG